MHDDLISICQIFLWELFLLCLVSAWKRSFDFWETIERCEFSKSNACDHCALGISLHFSLAHFLQYSQYFVRIILIQAHLTKNWNPNTCIFLHVHTNIHQTTQLEKLMIKEQQHQPTTNKREKLFRLRSFVLFEDITRWSIHRLTHAKLDPCFVFLFATGFCYWECLTRPERVLLLLLLFFFESKH